MTPNTDPPRYDWHKESPAVKLTALLIDRGCTTFERVSIALMKTVVIVVLGLVTKYLVLQVVQDIRFWSGRDHNTVPQLSKLKDLKYINVMQIEGEHVKYSSQKKPWAALLITFRQCKTVL